MRKSKPGGETSLTVELLELRAEGAVLLLLDNTFAKAALLFEATVEGNHVVTQTSRGSQLGDWCEERNEDSFKVGARTQWRRYKVEDVIPPASRQMVSMHFAVGTDWDVEVLTVKASVVPVAMAGARPRNHPFAPYAIRGNTLLAPNLDVLAADGASAEGLLERQEDAELQLALQLSLQDVAKPLEPRQRWGRRNKAEANGAENKACSICCEPLRAPGDLPAQSAQHLKCCAQVCWSCASRWAMEQEAQGLAAAEMRCPQCSAVLEDAVLRQLLGTDALHRAQERTRRRGEVGPSDLSSATLVRLGLKRCPGCGEGLQKESETCHKMICRTCRARFCFRCLTRLEPLPQLGLHDCVE